MVVVIFFTIYLTLICVITQPDVYERCKNLLNDMKLYCSQNYMDGNTNAWIIKPITNCSGHEIIISRDLNRIRKIIASRDGSKNDYILQKYIGKTKEFNTLRK